MIEKRKGAKGQQGFFLCLSDILIPNPAALKVMFGNSFCWVQSQHVI